MGSECVLCTGSAFSDGEFAFRVDLILEAMEKHQALTF
jgi:hypothetical protein